MKNVGRALADAVALSAIRQQYGDKTAHLWIDYLDSELNDSPLTSVVASLRTITGSEWSTIEDPWKALDEIRNGPPDNSNGSDK